MGAEGLLKSDILPKLVKIAGIDRIIILALIKDWGQGFKDGE